MAITRVELTNYRSYPKAVFDLHPGVTIVVGPNASGKTNLLESLYVMSTTKSFRAKDRDLVRHNATFFRVVVSDDQDQFALGLSIDNGVTKKVTHNDVKRTLSEHMGTLPVVLFEPTELDLVAGPPEARRRYLDLLLSQTQPDYLLTLHRYRRVLKQRNSLLEGFDIGGIKAQIFAWDIKLAELAARIVEERRQLITAINETLPEVYGEIAGESEQVEIEYLPTVHGREYGDNFLQKLTENLPRDLGAGFTTIGPHREDFKVHFKNNDIVAVASRGEVRTTVLALKLAELRYSEQASGKRPLLLLDDVFSELDSHRRGFLIDKLDGYQAVITTTDADAVVAAINQPHSIIETERIHA